MLSPLLDPLTERLGFTIAVGVVAALAYALAGTLVLLVFRVLVRRGRTISWSRFGLAVLLATAVATGAMFYLLDLLFSSGNVGGGSGHGAIVAVVVGLAGGGVAGLPVLLASFWWLGSRVGGARRSVSPTVAEAPSGAGFPRFLLRITLMLAVLPALFLSLAIEVPLLPWLDLGEVTPYVLFAMGVAGLVGLRESLFCSEHDTEKNKKITRFLLAAGIAAAAATTGILVWTSWTSASFLHRSNRSAVEWAFVLFLAASPIVIESWQLRKLQ